MKNRFFVGLVFFSLVSFGGLVVASQQPEKVLIVFNKSFGLNDTVHVENMGKFDRAVSCCEKLEKNSASYKNLSLSCVGAANFYFGCMLTKDAYDNTNISDLPQSSDALIAHQWQKRKENILCPNTVLLNEDGTFKDSVELGNLGKFKVFVHNVDVVHSDKGIRFIKTACGLSMVALLGLICWAYKNNVSFQDMQEALGGLLSTLYNVGK